MRKIMASVVFIIMLVVLSSCSSRELSKSAVVCAFGVDYKKGMFEAYALCYIPAGEADEAATSVLKSRANSLSTAMAIIGENSSLPLFWGHNSVLVTGSALSRSEKLNESLRYLMEDKRVRINVSVVCVDDVDECMNLNTEKNGGAGDVIEQLVSDDESIKIKVQLYELLSGGESITGFIPALRITHGKDTDDMALDSALIFTDGNFERSITGNTLYLYLMLCGRFNFRYLDSGSIARIKSVNSDVSDVAGKISCAVTVTTFSTDDSKDDIYAELRAAAETLFTEVSRKHLNEILEIEHLCSQKYGAAISPDYELGMPVYIIFR